MIQDTKMISYLKTEINNPLKLQAQSNSKINELYEIWQNILNKFYFEEIIPNKENVFYMNGFAGEKDLDYAYDTYENGDLLESIKIFFKTFINYGEIGCMPLKKVFSTLGEIGEIDFAYEVITFSFLLEKIDCPDNNGGIFPSITFNKEKEQLEEIIKNNYSSLPDSFMFKDEYNLQDVEKINKVCEKIGLDFYNYFLKKQGSGMNLLIELLKSYNIDVDSNTNERTPSMPKIKYESLKRLIQLHNEYKRCNIAK